jgi:anti-anti-sigma regulatory factor
MSIMKNDELINLDNDTPNEVDADDQNQADESYTVNLNSSLTIRDVSELIAELNQIDDDHNKVIFESEQLEKVDTAALQLLLGFYLFATNAGKKVIWNKPSEAFCHAAELLGLKEILNLKATSA